MILYLEIQKEENNPAPLNGGSKHDSLNYHLFQKQYKALTWYILLCLI